MRSLSYMLKLKIISSLICFALLMSSCNKDKDSDNDFLCPENLKTKTNYSQIEITEGLGEDKFLKSFNISQSQLNKGIDLNCDGVADFKVTNVAESDYYDGYAKTESELTFTISNPDLMVFTESVVDTIYQLSNTDTVGTTIFSSTESSNKYSPGAIFSSTSINTSVKGFKMGDVINTNDTRWQSAAITMRYAYSLSSNNSFGPDDNGYYIEDENVNSLSLGLIDSEFNYIAFKVKSSKGDKLGYIKLDAWAVGSSSYANFYFIHIQR